MTKIVQGTWNEAKNVFTTPLGEFVLAPALIQLPQGFINTNGLVARHINGNIFGVNLNPEAGKQVVEAKYLEMVENSLAEECDLPHEEIKIIDAEIVTK